MENSTVSCVNKDVNVSVEPDRQEASIDNLHCGISLPEQNNVAVDHNPKVKPLGFVNVTDNRVKELKAENKELKEKLKSKRQALKDIDEVHKQRYKLLDFIENLKDSFQFQYNEKDSPIENRLEELGAHIDKSLVVLQSLRNAALKFHATRKTSKGSTLLPPQEPLTQAASSIPPSKSCSIQTSPQQDFSTASRSEPSSSTRSLPLPPNSLWDITEQEGRSDDLQFMPNPSSSHLQPTKPCTSKRAHRKSPYDSPKVSKFIDDKKPHGEDIWKRETGNGRKLPAYYCLCGLEFPFKLFLEFHLKNVIWQRDMEIQSLPIAFIKAGDLMETPNYDIKVSNLKTENSSTIVFLAKEELSELKKLQPENLLLCFEVEKLRKENSDLKQELQDDKAEKSKLVIKDDDDGKNGEPSNMETMSTFHLEGEDEEMPLTRVKIPENILKENLDSLQIQREQQQGQLNEHSQTQCRHDKQEKGKELIKEQPAIIIDNNQEQQNKLLAFAESMKDSSQFRCGVADSPIVNHLEELGDHIRERLTSPPNIIYNTIKTFLGERDLSSYISLRPETLPSTSDASPPSTSAPVSASLSSSTLTTTPALPTNNSPIELSSPQSITESQQNAIASPSSSSSLPQPISPQKYTPKNSKSNPKKTTHHGENVGNRRSLRTKRNASFQRKCGKAFSNKLDLESHMTQCTAERSFECDVCQKQFSHVGYLNRHLRKAHPTDVDLNDLKTNWECQSCGELFATQELFDAHICPKKNQTTTNESINEEMMQCDDTADLEDHGNKSTAVTGDAENINSSYNNNCNIANITPTAKTDEEFVDIEN